MDFGCFLDPILDILLSQESSVSLTPASAITSEAVVLSEISPCSSVINFDEPKDGTASSFSQQDTAGQEVKKLSSSVEAEVLIKCLREAQVQVSESKNVDLFSKKLLNALVTIYAEEQFQLPEEKDWFDVIMLKKGSLAVLLLLLWTIAVFVIFSDFSHSKYGGSIPT
ncbi:OLC1v1020527C1 [Oldenlandia corymbosa var. corymbosa]|uniref:OLC1v1020527C1 n=1 Tax=Oldenlandia corymbosa var. corymbosa TaxID=529605 RepID=A0AAV1EGY3_OLDCO|nr:OLC1v1020527C1 [Oldenlandia corymbosa var. corymbosa]